MCAHGSLQIVLNAVCVALVISYIRPYILIPSIIMFIIFIFLRQYYLQTSRSVKRLEGVTKSPIFSQLSSSLIGMTSIRAFHAQERMIDEFNYLQDIHSSAWYTHLATQRWLAVCLDFTTVAYLTCCVLSFLLMPSGKL